MLAEPVQLSDRFARCHLGSLPTGVDNIYVWGLRWPVNRGATSLLAPVQGNELRDSIEELVDGREVVTSAVL